MKKQHIKNPEKWEAIRRAALTKLHGRRANKVLAEPVGPLLIKVPKKVQKVEEFLKCDKFKYKTEKEAYTVKMNHNKPKTMRIYYCDLCEAYHLTHSKKFK